MAKLSFTRNGKRHEYETELHDDKVADHSVQMTSYYTVVDPTWSIDYILDVQKAEREVGHEICGSPKSDGSPCKKYPVTQEKEPHPNEIGRCELHRLSMIKEEEVEKSLVLKNNTSILDLNEISLTPGIRAMLQSAENLYLNCKQCNIREVCNRFGKNNHKCVIEKEMFLGAITEMASEGNLENFTDYAVAISLGDTLVKMLRTSIHEGQYGLNESLAVGTPQYNAKLKELLYKAIKTLGLDRRTRIMIKRKDGRLEKFDGSLAKALSTIDIEDIKLKTSKLKDRIKIRETPPVGIGGEIIRDDEEFE